MGICHQGRNVSKGTRGEMKELLRGRGKASCLSCRVTWGTQRKMSDRTALNKLHGALDTGLQGLAHRGTAEAFKFVVVYGQNWRRKWQPSPVFLPGKFHGQRNLIGYSSWGHRESAMTEQISKWSKQSLFAKIPSFKNNSSNTKF